MDHAAETRLRCFARAALPEGAPTLLAVSGGSDSMALLEAARHVLEPSPVVLHVDHGLQAASARTADFVREQAQAAGLPFLLEQALPGPDDGAHSETSARRRRMAAFARAAQSTGASAVLLAHHLDDDLETLLLHLARGHTGDRARCGIPNLRPLDDRVVLARPFSSGPTPLTRQDLEHYRLARDLPHREDESNRDATIPRNRVRALLADLRGERQQLLSLRANARRRLARRVRGACCALERHLHAEGLGSRLDPAALSAPGGAPGNAPCPADEDAWSGHLAEVLRLLGPCLCERRRVHVRRALIRELQGTRAGNWSLPASPRPIEARVTAHGLHMPHDALDPRPPAARVLAALARTPLYL